MSTVLTSDNASPTTTAVSTTESDRARLYTPLCSWQTRLIKLLPGRRNDPLRCELHIAAITVESGLGIATELTAVQYEALSYSWGRPDLIGSIECNGMVTGIPPSMQDGLRQLRLEEESRWMWCDALCINQSVDEEKSAQGDAEPETEDMIRVIRHQNALHRKESDEYSSNIAGTETSKAIERLLKRPWFSRTWVRQEVFAAENLELQIGCHTLPFEHFIHASAKFMVSSPQLQTLISSYKEKFEEAEKEDLLGGLRASDIFSGAKTYTPRAISVLHGNKCFEVSDDRDRVYALIGIIDGLADYNLARRPHTRRLQHRFPIDYQRNCSFAYQNVIKYLINTDGDLRCLELLGDHSPVRNLPSWAIDWTSHALHCTEKAFTIPRYLVEASKCSSFRMQPAIQDFDELNQLRLKGFRLGTIENLSPDDMRLLHSAPHQFECYEPDYQASAPEPLYSESFIKSARNQIKQMLGSGELKLAALHGVLGPSSHSRKRSNCAVATTHRRHMCSVIVSRGVVEGDTVVLLHGLELIHVLRPTDSETTFTLICAGWFWLLGSQKSTRSTLNRKSVPFEEMTETLTAEMNLSILEAGLSKRLHSTDPRATTFEKRVFDLFPAQGNGPWSNYLRRQEEEEFVII